MTKDVNAMGCVTENVQCESPTVRSSEDLEWLFDTFRNDTIMQLCSLSGLE